MKRRAPAHPDRPTCTEGGPAQPIPELPAWKAFVVQFSRDTGTQPGVLSGRVEHLSSGRRVRFNTSEELLATLRTLVEDLCAVPTTPP